MGLHRAPDRRQRPRTARRGILLLVVLAIIAVLALISAGLLYRMDAERMGAQALNDLQQARAAAESGLSRAILLLRDYRTDMDEWWNNDLLFRRILVWAPDQEGGSTSLADQEEIKGRPAWRFSIVGYERELGKEEVSIRYGLTPESGKININTATRGQLLRLFDQFEFENVTSEELADALLDWRDSDNELTSPNGAESAYYMTRRPSYRAKNRPFETVEELLLVRGFTGRVLYGEDYNRNGYLDENEDDGPEGAFPFDNGDGLLDRGVYPFLTVYSWDWNFANDNKPRYDINQLKWSEPDSLPQPIVEELSTTVIDFLAEAQKRGFKFRSVGELWGLEVYEDASTNYDAAWESYKDLRRLENKVETEESEETDQGQEEQTPGDEQGSPNDDEMDQGPGDRADTGDQAQDRRTTARDRREARDRRNDSGDEQDQNQEDSNTVDKEQRRRQSVRDAEPGQEGGPNESDSRRRTASDRRAERDRRLEEVRQRAGGESGRGGEEGQNPDRRGRTGDETGGDGSGGGQQRKDPGTPVISPASAQDMSVAMDRLTVYNPGKYPALVGHINVNTAEPEVLKTILGLTEEDVDGIVARRSQMTSQDKLTPAWLVTTGAVAPERFVVTCNQLTTRSIQFTIDVIGFADHVGTARRLQAVVEMRGHMAQIRYYRDITSLGIGYPVKDDERSEGFAFTPGK